MLQLSRSYQIALGALVVFALAWFTVLRPADAVEPEPPLAAAAGAAALPGGLGTAVGKADAAAAAAARSAAAQPGADANAAAPVAPSGGAPAAVAGTTGATGTTGTTGATPGSDPSAPILRDVAAGKVAVVLFFSRLASDDRSVRRALLAADRHRGDVVVRAAPITRVAEYVAITEGVEVTQAPTIVVIGKGNRARTIVGLTDTLGIDQLVDDVGGSSLTPSGTGYRARAENLCRAIAQSTSTQGPEPVERLELIRNDLRDTRRALDRLEAPRRAFAFQRRFEADIALTIKGVETALKAQRAGRDGAAAFAAFGPRLQARGRSLQVVARRAGLSRGC